MVENFGKLVIGFNICIFSSLGRVLDTKVELCKLDVKVS